MKMDEKTLKLLIENNAVRQINIIGNGGTLYVEAVTPSGTHQATTQKGKLKTWTNLNSVAKWIRSLGIGSIQLQIDKWQPDQKTMLGNA